MYGAIVGNLTEVMYGIDDKLIKQVNEKIPDEFVKILNKTKNKFLCQIY